MQEATPTPQIAGAPAPAAAPAIDARWADNTPSQWIIAGSVTIVCMVALMIARRALLAKLKARDGEIRSGALASEARLLAYELVRSWLFLTTAVIGVRLGVQFLAAPAAHAVMIQKLFVVLAGLQGVRWAPVVLDWAIGLYLAKHRRESGDPDPAVAGAFVSLRWLGLFVLYCGLLLVVLQNLNVDVTALVTGLGIGGVAVALAMQNILGDLFGSLSITLDKPFVVGDFIVAGDDMGTIERIGVKTTRVRALSGEQLVFSNSDLLKSRIHNYKRMQERRVVFRVSATYETTPELLERVPGLIRRAIERLKGKTRFDRAHFFRFGDSSMDFEACYYVLSADYNTYMDVQQAILLDIARAFAAEGIAMPYPTQTLFMHVESMPKEASAPGVDRVPPASAEQVGARRVQPPQE